MKTISILFYTDIPDISDASSSWGCTDVQRFIKLKLAKIADVEITFKSRHFDLSNPRPTGAFTRLTHKLLCPFDELWVFCFGNEDTSDPNFRDYEFDDDEVEVLRDWMKRGGVMVTGDHSQPPLSENDACLVGDDHNKYLARGFPLGHRIPRARQMRVWKGPPTNCKVEPEKSDTQNTLEKVGSAEDGFLQSDKFPQTLEPMPSPPHFLFCYDLDASGQPTPIEFFPDHQHVGRVLIPQTYDESWPPRPPAPEFVAFGRDKRFTAEERVFPLVVAYDGHPAGVGRIVADASFHHFVNVNLKNLDDRDSVGNPKPDTALDQVAQFYANLAYWLAPKSLRDEIKRDLMFRTAAHLDVLETVGNGAAELGRVAKSVFVSEFGDANRFRIFEADDGEAGRPPADKLLAFALGGRDAPEGFKALDLDNFLGSVVEGYHNFFAAGRLNPLHLLEDPTPPNFLSSRVELAFRAMAGGPISRGADTSTGGPSGSDELQLKDNEMNSQADDEVTASACAGEWESEINNIFEGIFILRVDAHGKITGTFEGVEIEGGTCNRNHIIIRRREGRRVLVYEGDITPIGGGRLQARGTRRNEENFTEAEQDAAGGAEREGKAERFDDEWVATKVTTL